MYIGNVHVRRVISQSEAKLRVKDFKRSELNRDT